MVRSERFWILALAGTCFCAGLAAGVFFSMGRLQAPEPRPFHDFETRMVAAFDLDEERQHDLRYILTSYDRALEQLKTRSVRRFESELVRTGADHRNLIREYVVPRQFTRCRPMKMGGWSTRGCLS